MASANLGVPGNNQGGNNPPRPEPLGTVLGCINVNVKMPTFKGSATEDVDDHVRRFIAMCRSRGLEREDVYLVLFPSTLEGATFLLDFVIQDATFLLDFVVIKLPAVKGAYSLLIGRPWLRSARVLQDWGIDKLWIPQLDGSKELKLEEGMDQGVRGATVVPTLLQYQTQKKA